MYQVCILYLSLYCTYCFIVIICIYNMNFGTFFVFLTYFTIQNSPRVISDWKWEIYTSTRKPHIIRQNPLILATMHKGHELTRSKGAVIVYKRKRTDKKNMFLKQMFGGCVIIFLFSISKHFWFVWTGGMVSCQ